jgi:hypothetical protein
MSRKPHEVRLAAFRNTIGRAADLDPVALALYHRELEMDVRARQQKKAFLEKLRLLVFATMEGGSGLRVSQELRHFWYEYFTRIGEHGPRTLPSSFNILEAFLSLNSEMLAFELREEREHLLRFDDYIDWYTGAKFPTEPKLLIDVLEEATIYSYDFTLDSNSLKVGADSSELLIVGVALVRHGDELSVFVLAGESPPVKPTASTDSSRPTGGHETVKPHPELGPEDRLLGGRPDMSRIFLAGRFDLSNRLNDVRYILQDLGSSYRITTDEFGMLRQALGDGDDYRAVKARQEIQGHVQSSGVRG